MATDRRGPTGADIPMPTLNDDAVVQIHTFIAHVLDLFELVTAIRSIATTTKARGTT